MQGWAVCNSFRTFGLTHDRASSACSSPIRRNISSSCNTNPRNLQNSSDMSLGFFRKISPRREGMMMRDAHLCNRCRTLAAAHIYHAPVHARTHAEQKRVDSGDPGSRTRRRRATRAPIYGLFHVSVCRFRAQAVFSLPAPISLMSFMFDPLVNSWLCQRTRRCCVLHLLPS